MLPSAGGRDAGKAEMPFGVFRKMMTNATDSSSFPGVNIGTESQKPFSSHTFFFQIL